MAAEAGYLRLLRMEEGEKGKERRTGQNNPQGRRVCLNGSFWFTKHAQAKQGRQSQPSKYSHTERA
jgi:hypothetical protein